MVITELVCGLLQSDNFVRCLYLFSAIKLWISKMLGNNFHFAFYLLLLFFSHNVMSDSLKPHGLQHARLLCPPLFPRVFSNYVHRVSDAIFSSHLVGTELTLKLVYIAYMQKINLFLSSNGLLHEI